MHNNSDIGNTLSPSPSNVSSNLFIRKQQEHGTMFDYNFPAAQLDLLTGIKMETLVKAE